ncbi:MAG: hypothetical protein OJF49_004683 [Ktedonobacterales bacterium]|jgi:hypothetical protein|nr:MAG: hypothetical protein OJF49_004683 [Ktedonobacterales bacterium]
MWLGVWSGGHVVRLLMVVNGPVLSSFPVAAGSRYFLMSTGYKPLTRQEMH